MKIEDGTGQGFLARVNSQNHLVAAAVGVHEITHISSTAEGAYIMDFERTISSGGATEYIAHFQYTGNYKFQIDSIKVSRIDNALVNANQGWAELVGGVTYSSGGTAYAPRNINVGSSKSLDMTAYSGASTLTVDATNAVSIGKVTVSDFTEIDIKGALILNKNDQLALRGTSKTTGDIIRVLVTGFEVTEVI